MNDSWSIRVLRGLPGMKRADSLKRQHFKQQDSIRTGVRALEEAARSSLETDASLLQACGRLLQLVIEMHQETALLVERVKRLPDELGTDQQAMHQLMLIDSMHKALAGLAELRAAQAESRIHSQKLHQDVQQVVSDVVEMTQVERSVLTHTNRILELIGNQPGAARLVKAPDFGISNPEVGLMQHLYSFLPSRVAVDVGAHVGEVARRLLDVGYEVYAFEPCMPVFRALCERLGTAPDFHAASIAIGPEDGERQLNLVTDTSATKEFGDPTLFSSLVRRTLIDGLEFTSDVSVPMRSLESLWRTGEMPRDVGLLKIDTEGFDLEVIRGMGEQRPPVVMAEFWDPEAAIGGGMTSNRLHDLVGEMRRRGYHWHVVMYRLDGSNEVSYFLNRPASVPKSWGNVLFFQQYSVFAEAVRWCTAMLQVTHFIT